MKQQRRNHTVSRFYLSGFANDKNQIRRTGLAKPGEPHNMSTSDATVQTDFYLVQEVDGTLNDRIERYFGGIESRAALGFNALLDDHEWPPSPTTRERISTWVGLQFLRAPSERTMMNESAEIMLKLQMAVDGREGIRTALNYGEHVEATEDEVDVALAQYFGPGSLHMKLNPNEHIRFILEELRGVTSTMYARQWSVLEFRTESLITCDHPVVLVPMERESSFKGVGLLSAGGVFVPLNRRVGLLMGDVPPEVRQGEFGVGDAKYWGDTYFANYFNSLIIANAREAIFTHPDDAQLTQRPLPPPKRQELTHPDYKVWRDVGEKIRSGEGVLAEPPENDPHSTGLGD